MVNNSIVNNIKNYANKEGSGYSNWYCGIASDPKKRLFNDHNVPTNSWWIYQDAMTEQDARDTENYLLHFGFDGDTGGGDHSTTYVYAYKKIPGVTNENN